MGNQCTGTRVKGMISCIDFNKETLGKPESQFPDEVDIQKKINKYVDNFQEETRKRNRSKAGSVTRSQNKSGSSKSNVNITKNSQIIQDQSQGVPVEIKRIPKPHNKSENNVQASTNKRDNGLGADPSVDKDSGESSQKILKLDFNRLRAGNEETSSQAFNMKGIKKSEECSKSLWSSSEPECISPIEVNLKNLNFNQLIFNPENNRKDSSENINDFTLGEEEKSMYKMENSKLKKNVSIESTEKEQSEDSRICKVLGVNGYETPYLGMKVNPSVENLKKLPGCYLSDEDEDAYNGKKIIKNKNMKCDIDTANLVIGSQIKTRNIFYACNTDNSQAKKKIDQPPSDESLSDEAFVEDNEEHQSRQSRPSSYYQGIQQFKRRSSNGDSVLRNNNKQVEQK